MSALTSSHLLSIFGFNENDIFVGGAEGILLHYDGSQWSPMETGGRWTFKDIWGSAPDNVYAVVTDGRILHYDGKAWSPDEDMDKLPPMTGIFGLGPDEIYACSRLGKILRYDGSSWKYTQTGNLMIIKTCHSIPCHHI